ncbi:hypothetical protein L1987_72557 [Smallanthus sonchifolius]|uniref:Uncharacterized protein n=1 Tax=Smallanthus sonchifolius TaxID=185202 RepID=A0ACB9AVX9_9ASTR|nr:hypothetical protein L1987_72557 [Smallanthus sonchifolius]
MPSSTTEPQRNHLLESARPFLRGQLENVDDRLPSLVAVLKSVGAAECWHKHGSFLDHLIDIYRILKLWGVPDAVCLCGLFHSAYSNSYVNLAIFDPSTGRDVVRGHVGEAAERLIHLFCIVPRQQLIHDNLLFHYSDESELVQHLKDSEKSLSNARKGVFEVEDEEEWRRKIQSILPAEGIDVLFDNSDGMLKFSGNDWATALWPGDGKPGLWMTSISRMGAIYTLIVREEQLYTIKHPQPQSANTRDEEIELVTPPIFEKCTKILTAKDQIEARDLYWEGVCEVSKRGLDGCAEVLKRSLVKNPFVGEPHVVLGQVYLSQGRFDEAEKEAEQGLRLLLEWGSPWDKRMSWEGWIAWCRVLVMKAKENSWPQTSWGILNLGLVR